METESNLNRYLEEMSDMGLAIDWAVSTSPRFCINISQSGCHFARVSVSLCKDLALLKSSHLRELCDSFVRMLWEEYLGHLANSPTSNIHTCTCQFIISQVGYAERIIQFRCCHWAKKPLITLQHCLATCSRRNSRSFPNIAMKNLNSKRSKKKLQMSNNHL